MKTRTQLELVNIILEVINDDSYVQNAVATAIKDGGYTYPEKELSLLQESVSDALVTVEG